MNPFREIAGLFLPEVCPVCGGAMPEGAKIVCTECRLTLPATNFWKSTDNPVVHKFWGLIPVVNASAFIYFIGGSGYRDMIHSFKYRGMWRLAQDMGEWFGGELLRCGLYSDVDVVVPVPLHARKTLHRGYNQSEYIARGIAAQLGVAVDTRSVMRHKHKPPQAATEYRERWNNVEDVFSVRRSHKLKGRHILLVDDVLTTGATITSCAEAIIAAVPDCRISVVTLAVSKRTLGIT